jgi:Tol biopolymer transport system component
MYILNSYLYDLQRNKLKKTALILTALLLFAQSSCKALPSDNDTGMHKIAFASMRDGGIVNQIYVMNSDGTGQTRLSYNTSFNDVMPSWSPDGTKIAFQSDRDGNFEIYVMSADGSNQTRLTNNSSNDQVPCWSPDGTKIAFGSDRDGNFEIYVMNADGYNQTRLTNNSAQDALPSW